MKNLSILAVYCTGVFALMLLSLLETIVVMHLLGKEPQANGTHEDLSLSEDSVDRRGEIELFRCFYNGFLQYKGSVII